MSRTFHLLTGEYPPESGGVGDYTGIVAHGLLERGCTVHVWCPAVAESAEGGLNIHRLPDVFGAKSRATLDLALDSAPGCILLEYVPNALGLRGANLPFCLWLLRRRRRSGDVRVMFHEPYFYFSMERPWRNALAVTQRLMAAVLIRASRVAYISTATWIRYLRPYGSMPMIEMPIPCTIALDAAPDRAAAWRSAFAAGQAESVIVGHFGTFGDHVGRELWDAVPAILRAHAAARFVCIGRGGHAFAKALSAREPLLAGRVHATGSLSACDVSASLRACDLIVQPYPDGVTTRRTSVMAALANGLPVVTTEGALTEGVWRKAAGVQLVRASDAAALAAATVALLDDPGARRALGLRGRRLYDQRFALEHTLNTLLAA